LNLIPLTGLTGSHGRVWSSSETSWKQTCLHNFVRRVR
jgi:hypothetical protein